VVDHDLRLRLINFRVDIAKLEHVSLHRFLENGLGEFKDAFLIGGRGNDEADRKIV
jgi:hypothetical protein